METIYNTIVGRAANLRSTNPKANGLLYWTHLKKLFAPIAHISASEFIPIDKETYHRFMSLPEKTIDGYGNVTIIELHHFIIQLVRIPHNELPSIIKILQLAYNYGQYVGTREKLLTKSGTFNGIENVDTIYKFISVEDIQHIDQELKKNGINIENLCQEITNIFE